MRTCACGCGESVSPGCRYVQYHHLPRLHEEMRGETSPFWKGGRREHSEGYILAYAPDHPKASQCYVLEHVLIAEKALGKHLPDGTVVHHMNGQRDDNRPENLVVCQDQGYHALLHQRMRARDACGNPDWLKCVYCGEYDDPENLKVPENQAPYHLPCAARRMRKYKARKRAEAEAEQSEAA